MGALQQLPASFVSKFKAKFTTSQARRIFWEEILQSPIVERILAGQEDAARQFVNCTFVRK